MAGTSRTDLEEARLRLSEGLLRLWEQADLVDKLFVEGLATEGARSHLEAMQKTVDDMRERIDLLLETTGRSA